MRNVSRYLSTKRNQNFLTPILCRFQWVNLQIQFLCEFEFEQDILQNLGYLPESLEASYSKLYGGIEKLKGSAPVLVKRALMWLMCSQRPLKPEEWVKAVSWAAAMDSLDGLDLARLLHLCRYLVVVDDESKVVRFAHLSVREFLEKRFSEKDAHFMIAECYTAFLSRQGDVGAASKVGWNIPARWRPNSTFDLYATQHWISHVRACGEQKMVIKWHHLSEFLRNHGLYRWWLKFMLEMKGHLSLNREFEYLIYLESEASHPLFAIAYLGIDISIQGPWPSHAASLHNRSGKSLLFVASACGHEQMVDTLLSEGEEISLKGFDNPLVVAIIEGHRTVARTLHNNLISGGHNGLIEDISAAVALRGSRKSVEVLLDLHGIQVTEAVLIAAVSNYRRGNEVLEFLLTRGSGIIITEAVLMAAWWNPKWRELVELLLAREFELTVTGAILEVAPYNNPKHITYFMTELLPRVKCCNIKSTCLNFAAYYGNLALFESLLAKGVQFPASSEQRAALMIATLEGGNHTILETVQQLGCRFAESDEHGWTPRILEGEQSVELDFTSIQSPSGWVECLGHPRLVCDHDLVYSSEFLPLPHKYATFMLDRSVQHLGDC